MAQVAQAAGCTVRTLGVWKKYWSFVGFVAILGSIGSLHAQSQDRCA